MFDEKTGIDFPFYQNQLDSLFGDPTDSLFERDYLQIMDFTEFLDYFSHVKDYEGNKWGCRIYGNYVMEEPLRRAFRFICERGLAEELKTYDGCFNIRKKKGGSGYSVHSWGIAVDFNARTNAFGREPTLSFEFVKCFTECGFEWGGLWQPNNLRDGMHFQLAWIKDRTGELAPITWQA
jgi:hypothetical protein